MFANLLIGGKNAPRLHGWLHGFYAVVRAYWFTGLAS